MIDFGRAVLSCCEAWSVTVGPHDLLYVPAGMCFAERVAVASGDVFGLRVPLIACSFDTNQSVIKPCATVTPRKMLPQKWRKNTGRSSTSPRRRFSRTERPRFLRESPPRRFSRDRKRRERFLQVKHWSADCQALWELGVLLWETLSVWHSIRVSDLSVVSL